MVFSVYLVTLKEGERKRERERERERERKTEGRHWVATPSYRKHADVHTNYKLSGESFLYNLTFLPAGDQLNSPSSSLVIYRSVYMNNSNPA